MKTITYDYLGHFPEHISTIAQWHQDQWHDISPQLTTSLRIKKYSAYPSQPGIPCCHLALVDNCPAGSASLVKSDMETHSNLSPWLASVYVHSEFRNLGIATHLINMCIDSARKANIQTLYLFTPDQLEFYLSRGWKLLKPDTYHGEHVDIMSFDLQTNED